MNEPTHSVPLDGTIVEPTLVDRTVAFFVALNDDAVDKSWSDFGKAALALGPVVLTLAATKGKGGKKRLTQLIGPGIALGKLVTDVNRQVSPAHISRAQELVAQAKQNAAGLRARQAKRAR